MTNYVDSELNRNTTRLLHHRVYALHKTTDPSITVSQQKKRGLSTEQKHNHPSASPCLCDTVHKTTDHSITVKNDLN